MISLWSGLKQNAVDATETNPWKITNGKAHFHGIDDHFLSVFHVNWHDETTVLWYVQTAVDRNSLATIDSNRNDIKCRLASKQCAYRHWLHTPGAWLRMKYEFNRSWEHGQENSRWTILWSAYSTVNTNEQTHISKTVKYLCRLIRAKKKSWI